MSGQVPLDLIRQVAVLCCAVLCCAVLCCAVLCCAVLCCAVRCRAVLCCAATFGVLHMISGCVFYIFFWGVGGCMGAKWVLDIIS